MAALPTPLLCFILFLLSSSTTSYCFSLSNYQTLLSLSHSIAARVATLRADRGDLEGAVRARALSRSLERGVGLGFCNFAWNEGWDYLNNYPWRDTMSFASIGGVVSDLNELLLAFSDFNRIQSGGLEAERVAWADINHKNALRVLRSLFARLLQVFSQSGPLREVVETLQKEVMGGDLLLDCLELCADDLKDLIQVARDTALDFSSVSYKTDM